VRTLVLLGWCITFGACGGGESFDQPAPEENGTTGGEQGTAATPGGGQADAPVDPQVDPAAASLDAPPPAAPTGPANLVAAEGIPAEGLVREEPRREGGVRLVMVLPAAADGETVLEVQTTPGRSGDIASVAVRARHPQPRWTACSTLVLELDGRSTPLTEPRVIAGPASEQGALETALATVELRDARRLLRARAWRVVACDEGLTPAPATRPTLERFFARAEELARGGPAAPGPGPGGPGATGGSPPPGATPGGNGAATTNAPGVMPPAAGRPATQGAPRR
jgi:hypothetical protein